MDQEDEAPPSPSPLRPWDGMAERFRPTISHLPPRAHRGARIRKALILRDGPECCWCGGLKGPMTVEHLRPRGMGGTWKLVNLALACLPCNGARGCSLGPPPLFRLEGWAALAWRDGVASWVP